MEAGKCVRDDDDDDAMQVPVGMQVAVIINIV